MTKFRNTFLIESARLSCWNYSNPWWYYITINTKEHPDYFGIVNHEKMMLNELGLIADKCWTEIPEHFNEVELDAYVIMPNHIHGIIIINPAVETPHGTSQNELIPGRTGETSCRTSLQLGTIVNQFKGAITRWAGKNGFENFRWQSRFYDRIIRNEKELQKIRKYINQNPLKWFLEKEEDSNIDCF